MGEKRIRYYVIITILVLYLGVMFVFFIYPAMKDNKNQTYLIVNDTGKWMYENGKWKDIESQKLYNWQKFDIYQGASFIGNYNLLYNDGWYLFDDDRNPISKDGVNLFAIRTNQKYKYANFVLEDISPIDMKYVYQVLEENDITANNLTTMNSFSFDLDSDGQKEKVFILSNVFTEEIASKYVFNFIFMVKNEKITMIAKTIDTFDNMYDNCKMYVAYLVDLTGDGSYEVITGCGYFSDRGQCMEMYEYKKNKYVKVKKCK